MKPCLERGCPEVVDQGRCAKHDRGRTPFKQRYGISTNKWAKIRRRVIRRDGSRCVDCGGTDHLEVDHVVRRVDGGTNDDGNLRTRCRSCHRIKTAADRRDAWPNTRR